MLADLTTPQLEALDKTLSEKLAAVGDLRFRRPLTPAEQRTDFVKLNERWDTAEADIAKAVAPVLKKQQARLLDQSGAILKKAKASRGLTLAADVDVMSAGYLGAYQGAALGELKKVFDSGAQSVRTDYSGAHKAAGTASGIDSLKQWAEHLAREAEQQLTAKASSSIFNGLLRFVGLATWDITDSAMLDSLGAGLETTATKIATTQARSWAGRAINAGRDAAAAEFDFVAAQWADVLDVKTCPLCRYLDGMRVPFDERDAQVLMPGLIHFGNCRCSWVYLLPDDPDAEDFNWIDPPDDLLAQYAPEIF